MTSTLPASVDGSRIRQLIIEAERVIREIERLPEFATDADGRSWAEFTAEGARRAWANLLSVLRRGDAPYFTTRIRTVVAFGVLLAEAPPALKASAADVRVFTTALAEDYFDRFSVTIVRCGRTSSLGSRCCCPSLQRSSVPEYRPIRGGPWIRKKCIRCRAKLRISPATPGFDHAVSVTTLPGHRVVVLTTSTDVAETISAMVRSRGCVTESLFDVAPTDRTWSA